MTQDQAHFIKELKIKKGKTFNEIHIEFQKKFLPREEWYYSPIISVVDRDRRNPQGDALSGYELCKKAIHTLNESKDKWDLIDN